ncbi:hypothetical protein GCM10025868_32070 [Angustibacter aerolatus]|uniref:Uncharacterized protein n=1 Tax=Angustibacter aerolatus TaxID=1162965 RepID=A0ABQ6JIA4_9ACTN|nr:hypothetical protein GCM10025868_32070 [Angustibacter aerolatus]
MEQSVLLAETEGVWALSYAADADVPGWCTTEVVVGPATLDWPVHGGGRARRPGARRPRRVTRTSRQDAL